MRNTFALSILAVGTLLVTGAVAQHEGHEGHTAPPAADKSADMPMNGMMGQMMPIMAMHEEVAKLADQLVTSFAAIESEKDPAALKEKLAEHGKLLKELQTKLQGQSQMMEHMHGMMMGGKMMGGKMSMQDKKQ
jgi:hypothetical protein